MKKVVFLLASILVVGFSTVHAQDVLKFASFDFYKGVVSIDQNRYDSFTFTLKLKDKSNIEVCSVLVNGVEAEYQVFEWIFASHDDRSRLLAGDLFLICCGFTEKTSMAREI